MTALYAVSAVMAMFAQLWLLRIVLRLRPWRARPAGQISEEAARLHLEWTHQLVTVFRAAREVIALCPACHLGLEEPCRCEQRRQRLAVAVSAAEDFAAAHASGSGGKEPRLG
ncbi:MAG: hypothetical protein M3Y04_05820 [Actinomycetota bacterium]|nr:hypothetical protein [Actinomycetota bacterium]